MTTTKVSVLGELTVAATADTTGETIARSGVRLMNPTGSLVMSDSGVPTVAAPIGSLYLRSDVAELWQNTNGSTAWSKVGGGGAAFSGVSASAPTQFAMDANTWYAVSFTQLSYNVGDYWSEASPTRFYAPATGYYHITAGGWFSGSYNRTLALAKNAGGAGGESPPSGIFSRFCCVISSPTISSLETTVALSSGDYVELFFNGTHAGQAKVIDDSPFTMQRVG